MTRDQATVAHQAALAFAELGRDLRRAQTVGYVVIPAGQAARYEEYLIQADDRAYRLVRPGVRGV